jgi:hypothetical protein
MPFDPKIPPELALKKLQQLLEQIPKLRSSGYNSSGHSTWEGNVKIVLADFYGENSLVFNEFDEIWFTPGMYYNGQPKSEFVDAFNRGLDNANGFLESRVNDLRERIEHSKSTSVASSSASLTDDRKVFVVHGHDHGNKETVARFLENLDLEPVILHEQPDRGKTIIEKFETHAGGVQVAVVILTADDVLAQNPTRNLLRRGRGKTSFLN